MICYSPSGSQFDLPISIKYVSINGQKLINNYIYMNFKSCFRWNVVAISSQLNSTVRRICCFNSSSDILLIGVLPLEISFARRLVTCMVPLDEGCHELSHNDSIYFNKKSNKAIQTHIKIMSQQGKKDWTTYWLVETWSVNFLFPQILCVVDILWKALSYSEHNINVKIWILFTAVVGGWASSEGDNQKLIFLH